MEPLSIVGQENASSLEVSLLQRLICTQKYIIIGTSENVLIREVSIKRERFQLYYNALLLQLYLSGFPSRTPLLEGSGGAAW